MVTRIFIDGEAGTTGLGIRQRLEALSSYPLELLSLAPEFRKDSARRRAMMEAADIAVLCLPDEAAREAVALGAGLDVRFLDASTAHRVAENWVYGLPELAGGQEEKIRQACFVSNPGCYATGAIALLRPLVAHNLLSSEALISINAVSGYSGGGKAMINAHEETQGPAFELYGLNLNHKHLPEIMHYSGLRRKPLFVPSVGHFAQGMIVSIPLHLVDLPGCPSAQEIETCLRDFYKEAKSIFVEEASNSLNAQSLAGQDNMALRVHSDGAEQVVLTACLDNLGKGASGAAVRNLLLMAGLE